MLKGMLVAFEGLDRVGKTTHARMLATRVGSRFLRFPDRMTQTGKQIDQLLKSTVNPDPKSVLRLFAANRQQKLQQILAARKQTGLVIDRYSHSGIAYAMARGSSLQQALPLEAGLPKPDLVIWLHAPTDRLQQRAGYGQQIYENTKFQKLVELAYHKIFQHDDRVTRVSSCDRAIQQVHQQINRTVQQLAMPREPIYF